MLAPTWTCRERSAPLRDQNSSQWRCAGLYDPICPATTVSSNGTPSFAFDASIWGGSEFERTASFHPRRRSSVSAAGTSGNGSHDGTELARTAALPVDAPSPDIASVIT